jgi:hypothetical protein
MIDGFEVYKVAGARAGKGWRWRLVLVFLVSWC